MPDDRAVEPTVELTAPHALPVAEVAAALQVEPAIGLDPAEAARRLELLGPNELVQRDSPRFWRLLIGALTEPFVLLLLGAGVLAIALGETRDGLLILLGLVPIVGADVVTEYRAERALEALRASAAPRARVRRGAELGDVPAADLVPGDVVLLGVGDIVPADMRVVRSEAMLIERAVLTGESLPEPATLEADPRDAPLVERRAVALAGTSVVQGRGEGIVVATGARSELGRIAAGLRGEERRRSPLQRELDRLVRILLVVAVVLIAVTSGLALVRGEPLGVAVLAGVAAAIAAIPEEPPVLLAVVLGLGAYRLLRRGVLVRRLNAQETLSAVDLIITDKTGTLTTNRLELEEVLTPSGTLHGTARRRVVEDAYRAEDDAWHASSGTPVGSFTRALQRALTVDGEGLDAASEPPPLDPVDLLESDPVRDGRPYTRTRVRLDREEAEFVLGAPEAVLTLLGRGATDWAALAEREAGAGRRLLLLAVRPGAEPARAAGLLAFADPVRTDVAGALHTAREAGIQVLMVTGDHPTTAARVADAAGLPRGTVIIGDELAGWDERVLAHELPRLRVVARALPEHKMRLVGAARRGGRTVAVTGDGVNDGPALQHADVGVAMGSGAAVAREASDLVLGDDSFSTLMNALREGRRMVANVQKGLVFLFSTHVAMLGFLLIATIYGFSQPLLPIQILWLEFFIDISASIAFEREPEEPGQMRQPPRARETPLLETALLARITAAGGFTAVAALAIMSTHGGTIDEARWVAFNVLVVGQLVRAYANRSLRQPVLALRRNTFLLLICAVVLVIQLLIPVVPVLAEAFRAVALDAGDWVLVVGVAIVPAVVAEMIRRRSGRVWVA